jgi:hypothetical protein
MAVTKDIFTSFMIEQPLLQRLLVYMVNNRIQEFTDPLTSTLVLLATSNIQLVFCESGLILFKSSLLPIFPYSLLLANEKKMLEQWVLNATDEHESADSSGQFAMTIPLFAKQPPAYVCKKALLSSFVHVMRHHNGTFNDPLICCTLCNIILQRFMAIVPISSDITSAILLQLNVQQPLPTQSLCPLLCQPSDSHFELQPPSRKRPAPTVPPPYKKNKKHATALP